MIQFVQDLLKGTDKILVRNLVILHTLIIAVSNYLVTIRFSLFAEKINILGWETNFPLAAAAFTFPLVVVASDLTVRLIGKQSARAVVALAIIPAIVASVLVLLYLGDKHAYRVGIASGVAYGIGTLLDVYVFQHIRERFKTNISEDGKAKKAHFMCGRWRELNPRRLSQDVTGHRFRLS
jgi:uncharacterized integral membrane protein (TIGR00697 family)